MKAIVLTCDKYRALTEHMIFQYGKLWPDNPFHFRIPYQELLGTQGVNREYIRCPIGIRDTVLTLLDDLGDDEWIYWCIDDKYPIALNLHRIKSIVELIPELPSDVSGILYCRCRNMLKKRYLTGKKFKDRFGNSFLERKDYSQIWLHQFLRVKVVRHLFGQFPENIPNAKLMDALIKEVRLPAEHSLYVTEKNLSTFGESTSRGKLTLNCHKSIMKNNLPLPQSIPLNNEKSIVMGDGLLRRLLLWW